MIIVSASCVLVSACTLTPPDEDPVIIKLDNLERRLEAIERVLASGSLIDLTLQMDAMERRTAELQGRMEQLEYDSAGSGDRQRTLYADLDDRIQNLEASLQRAVNAVNVLDGGL